MVSIIWWTDGNMSYIEPRADKPSMHAWLITVPSIELEDASGHTDTHVRHVDTRVCTDDVGRLKMSDGRVREGGHSCVN